jgi:hypothetical protein
LAEGSFAPRAFLETVGERVAGASGKLHDLLHHARTEIHWLVEERIDVLDAVPHRVLLPGKFVPRCVNMMPHIVYVTFDGAARYDDTKRIPRIVGEDMVEFFRRRFIKPAHEANEVIPRVATQMELGVLGILELRVTTLSRHDLGLTRKR